MTVNDFSTIWSSTPSVQLNTGTWRTALPHYVERQSPCHNGCPVKGEIAHWITYLGKGDYRKAWLELVKNNPFPSIIGRICHHPCEARCNRSEYDGKVSIRMLERFIGDFALMEGWALPMPKKLKEKNPAVIGSGPAGLSVAYFLALEGYPVTIYEAKPCAGGLLRYGIPPYRLPVDILDLELQRLFELGIDLKTSHPVESAKEFAKLTERHEAIFLAIGAGRSLSTSELGGCARVIDGIDFLARFNSGSPDEIGERVAVVGGGNTAVDVARVAKRLGAKMVTVVYRRTREQMPVQESELAEAEEEGVQFQFLSSPLRIKEDERLQLVCQEMRLGEKDRSGRPEAIPVAGAGITLEVDTVIAALGTEPDLKGLHGIVRLGDDRVIAADEQQATHLPGLFAGGDMTTHTRYASEAISSGRRGARGIMKYLGEEDLEADDREGGSEHEVTFSEINTYYYPAMPGSKGGKLAVDTREDNFSEVQLAIPVDQASEEAGRCFSCGLCVECNNCFYLCPDMAVVRDASDQKYAVLEQYCKGCGLCAVECPRGVILLKGE